MYYSLKLGLMIYQCYVDVTDSTHSLIPYNNVIEVDHLSYTTVDYMRCCLYKYMCVIVFLSSYVNNCSHDVCHMLLLMLIKDDKLCILTSFH